MVQPIGMHVFECGWVIREVALDELGRDFNGWEWRVPPGSRLFRCDDPDAIESVTVIAPNMGDAVVVLNANGMPPKTLSKVNWHTGGQAA